MKKLAVSNPRAIYVPLALVPFAYLVSMVARYKVNVPFLDDWEIVPLLVKLDDHTFTLRDLWAQHNEHRPLIPQAIMLANAKLTAWNVGYEMGLSLVLAAAMFVVFMRQVEATGEAVKSRWVAIVAPAVAVLTFSFSQYQNWLWGWQSSMYLNALAIVASIVMLASPPFRWSKFVASFVLGVVALYSFANGMLIWPIGAAIIALAPHYRDRGLLKCLGLWIAASTIAAASYLFGYATPTDGQPLTYVLGHMREFVEYVFCYLGGPGGLDQGAWSTGVAITLVALASAIVVLKLRRIPLSELLPYFALCAYVFASSLLTGVGRIQYGIGQSLASRYTLFAGLLWSSVLVLLALIVFPPSNDLEPETASRSKGRKGRDSEPSGPGRGAARVAAAVAILWILVRAGKTSLDQRQNFVQLSQLQTLGAAQIRAYLSPERTPLVKQLLLYPDATKMVDRARYLQGKQLSLFRDRP